MMEAPSEAAKFDARTLRSWWSGLQPDRERGQRGDPAALAELRRCRSPNEVMFVPAFEVLARLMPSARVADLAVAAAVVAHLREDLPGPVAVQLARGDGGRPVLSPMRLRRLLQVTGPEGRIEAGRRLARALRGRADVADLADSLYWWDEDDATQRSWARAYYSNVPAEYLKK